MAGFCATNAYAQSSSIYQSDDPTFVMQSGAVAQAVGKQSFYYDSNPLLLTTGERSLWGSITSPELILSDQTPETTVNSDTVFNSNNFNEPSFDSNDVHSKLNFSTKNEQWTTSLLSSVDYDTTRSSEISVYGNNNTTPIRHLGDSFAPQITYSALPSDRLGLSGSFLSSTYATNSVFTNYDVISTTPSYAHDFDERNTGTFSVQGQRYITTNGPSDIVTSVGPLIGWQTIFTERLTGQASVGYQEVQQKDAAIQDPAWKGQYSFLGNLTYKGNQDLIIASASRNEYPFGNGTEAYLTQLTLNETHAINDLFSIGLQGSYQSADYQNTANGNLKSLATAGASFIYHATDQIDLTASYQYQDESLVGESVKAEAHTGLLSVIFRPKGWTL